MKRNINKFFRDEDGAITVDWVVLTASVVALGIGVLIGISNATAGLEERAANAITSGDDSQLD